MFYSFPHLRVCCCVESNWKRSGEFGNSFRIIRRVESMMRLAERSVSSISSDSFLLHEMILVCKLTSSSWTVLSRPVAAVRSMHVTVWTVGRFRSPCIISFNVYWHGRRESVSYKIFAARTNDSERMSDIRWRPLMRESFTYSVFFDENIQQSIEPSRRF